MRVLVTSDWHLDAVTAGVPRRDEVLAFAAKILNVAIEAKPDLFLHLGDWYTPGSMRDALYASDVARFIAAMQRCLSSRAVAVYLAGNHDELDLFDREHPDLDPSGADPEARFAVSTLSAALAFRPERSEVCEEPRVVLLPGQWALLALPHCAPVMGIDYAAAIRAVVERKRNVLNPEAKWIVAAHLTIPGAMLGSESRELARGRDDLLPVDEIAKLSPRLIVNGHYHRPQTVPSAAGDIVIPGSPVRMTFAERDDLKGYLLIDLPE